MNTKDLNNIFIIIIVFCLINLYFKNKKKIKEQFRIKVHAKNPWRSIAKDVSKVEGRLIHELEAPLKNLVPTSFKNKIDINAFNGLKQLNPIKSIGSAVSNIENFVEVNGIDALNKAFNKLEDNVQKSIISKWDDFKNFTENIGQSIEKLNNHIFSTLNRVLSKMGEEEMLLLKSLLDPCAYLLPYGCPLLVSSLAGTLESAFAEEEIEEEAEFDAMAEAIKSAIAQLETKVKYMTAQALVNSLMVPLIAPMLTLALHTISNDQSFINKVSPQVCNMVSKVLTQLIVEQDGLVVYTMIVIQYCTALMCTGVFYNIPVDEFIPGYTPYVYLAANALGINCNKKKTEAGYNKNKYDKLNKENKDYVIVKDGTCESHGHKSLKSTDKCKLAGEFHGYNSNMGSNNVGNVGEQGAPHGCVFQHKTGKNYEARMYPDGQALCSNYNQCVCMKDKNEKPNSVIVKNGSSCEDSGYRTIIDQNRCLKELRSQGYSGMSVPYYKLNKNGKIIGLAPHYNASSGTGRPYGCSVKSDKKTKGTYEARNSGDCGSGGFDCLCDNIKPTSNYKLDFVIDDIDGAKKVPNELNVISRDNNFVKIKGSSCEFANLQPIGPTQCKEAASVYGKNYHGVNNTPDYNFGKPGCAQDLDGNNISYYSKGIFCGPNMDCICESNAKPLSNVDKSLISEGICSDGINNIEIKDEEKCSAYANKLGLKYGGVDNSKHFNPGNNTFHTAQCGYDTSSHEVKFYSNGLDCNEKENCLCAGQEIETVEKIGNNYVKVLDNMNCSDHKNYRVDNGNTCSKIAVELKKNYYGVDKTRKYKNSNPGCGFDSQHDTVKFYQNGLNCNNNDSVNCLCTTEEVVSQPSSSTTTEQTKKLGNYTEILNKTTCSSNNVLGITSETQCKKLASDTGKKYGNRDRTRKYSSSSAGCGFDSKRNTVKFYQNGLNCANNEGINCLCSNSSSTKKLGNYTEILSKTTCSSNNVFGITTESQCNKLASDTGKKYGKSDRTRKYSSSSEGCGFDSKQNTVKFYQNGLNCANNDGINCLCSNSSSTTKLGNYTEILNKTTCSSNNVSGITTESQCKKLASDIGKKYGNRDRTRKYSSSSPGCGFDSKQNTVKFYQNGLNCANNDGINCLCSNS